MIIINAIFALVAVIITALAVYRRGARIYVNLYALGVALWGLCVFGGAAIGIIPEDRLSPLMRPAQSLTYIYIIIAYITERRGRHG